MGDMAVRTRRYGPRVRLAIDHQGDVPAWLQLYGQLRAGIADGTYPPRTPLPSSRYIQETTGLARPTIAKAYARLRSEGLIRMVPGKGPFVAPRE